MEDRDILIILLVVALVGALASITRNLETPLLITLWVAEVPIGVLIHFITRGSRPLQIIQETQPLPSIEDQKWLAEKSPRVYDFLKAIPAGIGPRQYKIYLAQLELLLMNEKEMSGDLVEDYQLSNQVEMIARAFLLGRHRKG